jgi:hypothetical protein
MWSFIQSPLLQSPKEAAISLVVPEHGHVDEVERATWPSPFGLAGRSTISFDFFKVWRDLAGPCAALTDRIGCNEPQGAAVQDHGMTAMGSKR